MGGGRRPSNDSGHFLCSYSPRPARGLIGHKRLHPGRTITSMDGVYFVSRQGLQSLSVCPCPLGKALLAVRQEEIREKSERIHIRKLGLPSSPGESVLAVRQNWKSYCIRKGVRHDNVGALPFFNKAGLLRNKAGLLENKDGLCCPTGEKYFPRREKIFSPQGRKKDTPRRADPCIAKQSSNYATVNTSIRAGSALGASQRGRRRKEREGVVGRPQRVVYGSLCHGQGRGVHPWPLF